MCSLEKIYVIIFSFLFCFFVFFVFLILFALQLCFVIIICFRFTLAKNVFILLLFVILYTNLTSVVADVRFFQFKFFGSIL